MTRARPRSLGAIVGAAAADAILIAAFAVTGRGSHDERLDLLGVVGTAWPFLAGAAIGWVAIRAWRRPLAVWPTGVVVWACALVGGMLLRVLTGQGTATAFIIVAALTLALFLIGWRAAVAAALEFRTRRRTGAAAR
ncbi:peptidoglycan/LPS O-acetylase OafA/YrhL [Agromyces flavus]|uniref:Peptidoglycan/LPS O-acetylase OafA/YrhL n=1 Tax=Agromyces flavus TaxID=589382 RepID=A0A1H1MLS7_9MICO|nr:DUF3054 domain-containing protein [Agromyces flavus]MCP2369243.1 peptidoglycan/LPS O-acetylase OafA/YrhL [Agromyces flavus]GGI48724.1 membrane protein [Agromyces flavus]SDR87550.1 Protein of unknown function [Agromyces flavus]